ncbi:hypothetical protein Tco_0323292 [Tanacetum coccineum]
MNLRSTFKSKDNALWEVIENGDSLGGMYHKTAQENGTSVTKMSIHVTAEEKTNKKNDVKARSLLLMALPNEHQLTFTSKKTQKTLLKKQYENFSASSAESLDSIFNRLQKIVKKFVGESTGAQNLAFMTAPSTSSTNDANTASPQVSMVNPRYSDSTIIRWDTFARECRAQEARKFCFQTSKTTPRNQGNNEERISKINVVYKMVLGFDWSYLTKEQVQTNIALMAFSDSEVFTDKTCSKTCLKNYETLKKQCDDLIVKLNQTEFTTATYKRGLATVEEQLITYRKNGVLFSEEVAVLKREVACKDYEI